MDPAQLNAPPPSGPALPLARESVALGPHIRTEVMRLCTALASLFVTLPGAPRRSSEIARVLDIDMPVASRLARMAQASEALEAIEAMPTINQVRRVVARAKALAPGRAAEHADAVIARFEELMRDLGTDQREFESVASMHMGGGVRRVELAQRRAAFRANAHLWGLSVECLSMLFIALPSTQPGVVDAVLVYGYLGARMRRPGVRFQLGVRVHHHESPPPDPNLPEAQLIEQYSTVPGASVRRVDPDNNFSVCEVCLDSAHPADSHTVFTRQYLPACKRTDDPRSCYTATHVTWPAGNLQLTLAVPVGLSDPDRVSLQAHANRKNPVEAFARHDADGFPLQEVPTVYRDTDVLPPTSLVPHLPDMFASAVQWAGRAGTRFDIYRCDVPFPMLHALLTLRAQWAARG